MPLGKNLQYLRKMHDGMTQEALAEKMDVTRQTISKWEMDAAYPEMEKAIQLCRLFSCTLDELLMGSISLDHEAYGNLRTQTHPAFAYHKHTVISSAPEEDAKRHIQDWAASKGIPCPHIIGWDFPCVSQEQINVYHMHGYTAACILPEGFHAQGEDVLHQAAQPYAVITIREPFANAFVLIPNAYKTLMRYMDINGLAHSQSKTVLPCFEKEYEAEGVVYMDVYMAVGE